MRVRNTVHELNVGNMGIANLDHVRFPKRATEVQHVSGPSIATKAIRPILSHEQHVRVSEQTMCNIIN